MSVFVENLFKERPKTSFKISYIFVFIFWNWKGIYLLFNSNNFLEAYTGHSTYYSTDLYIFFKENWSFLGDLLNYIVIHTIVFIPPLVFSYIYIVFISRLLNKYIYKKQLINDFQRKEYFLEEERRHAKKIKQLNNQTEKDLNEAIKTRDRIEIAKTKTDTVENNFGISSEKFLKMFAEGEYERNGFLIIRVGAEDRERDKSILTQFMELYDLAMAAGERSSRTTVWRLTERGKELRKKMMGNFYKSN